jgi:hypothetical protein
MIIVSPSPSSFRLHPSFLRSSPSSFPAKPERNPPPAAVQNGVQRRAGDDRSEHPMTFAEYPLPNRQSTSPSVEKRVPLALLERLGGLRIGAADMHMVAVRR